MQIRCQVMQKALIAAAALAKPRKKQCVLNEASVYRMFSDFDVMMQKRIMRSVS